MRNLLFYICAVYCLHCVTSQKSTAPGTKVEWTANLEGFAKGLPVWLPGSKLESLSNAERAKLVVNEASASNVKKGAGITTPNTTKATPIKARTLAPHWPPPTLQAYWPTLAPIWGSPKTEGPFLGGFNQKTLPPPPMPGIAQTVPTRSVFQEILGVITGVITGQETTIVTDVSKPSTTTKAVPTPTSILDLGLATDPAVNLGTNPTTENAEPFWLDTTYDQNANDSDLLTIGDVTGINAQRFDVDVATQVSQTASTQSPTTTKMEQTTDNTNLETTASGREDIKHKTTIQTEPDILNVGTSSTLTEARNGLKNGLRWLDTVQGRRGSTANPMWDIQTTGSGYFSGRTFQTTTPYSVESIHYATPPPYVDSILSLPSNRAAAFTKTSFSSPAAIDIVGEPHSTKPGPVVQNSILKMGKEITPVEEIVSNDFTARTIGDLPVEVSTKLKTLSTISPNFKPVTLPTTKLKEDSESLSTSSRLTESSNATSRIRLSNAKDMAENADNITVLSSDDLSKKKEIFIEVETGNTNSNNLSSGAENVSHIKLSEQFKSRADIQTGTFNTDDSAKITKIQVNNEISKDAGTITKIVTKNVTKIKTMTLDTFVKNNYNNEGKSNNVLGNDMSSSTMNRTEISRSLNNQNEMSSDTQNILSSSVKNNITKLIVNVSTAFQHTASASPETHAVTTHSLPTVTPSPLTTPRPRPVRIVLKGNPFKHSTDTQGIPVHFIPPGAGLDGDFTQAFAAAAPTAALEGDASLATNAPIVSSVTTVSSNNIAGSTTESGKSVGIGSAKETQSKSEYWAKVNSNQTNNIGLIGSKSNEVRIKEGAFVQNNVHKTSTNNAIVEDRNITDENNKNFNASNIMNNNFGMFDIRDQQPGFQVQKRQATKIDLAAQQAMIAQIHDMLKALSNFFESGVVRALTIAGNNKQSVTPSQTSADKSIIKKAITVNKNPVSTPEVTPPVTPSPTKSDDIKENKRIPEPLPKANMLSTKLPVAPSVRNIVVKENNIDKVVDQTGGKDMVLSNAGVTKTVQPTRRPATDAPTTDIAFNTVQTTGAEQSLFNAGVDPTSAGWFFNPSTPTNNPFGPTSGAGNFFNQDTRPPSVAPTFATPMDSVGAARSLSFVPPTENPSPSQSLSTKSRRFPEYPDARSSTKADKSSLMRLSNLIASTKPNEAQTTVKETRITSKPTQGQKSGDDASFTTSERMARKGIRGGVVSVMEPETPKPTVVRPRDQTPKPQQKQTKPAPKPANQEGDGMNLFLQSLTPKQRQQLARMLSGGQAPKAAPTTTTTTTTTPAPTTPKPAPTNADFINLQQRLMQAMNNGNMGAGFGGGEGRGGGGRGGGGFGRGGGGGRGRGGNFGPQQESNPMQAMLAQMAQAGGAENMNRRQMMEMFASGEGPLMSGEGAPESGKRQRGGGGGPRRGGRGRGGPRGPGGRGGPPGGRATNRMMQKLLRHQQMRARGMDPPDLPERPGFGEGGLNPMMMMGMGGGMGGMGGLASMFGGGGGGGEAGGMGNMFGGGGMASMLGGGPGGMASMFGGGGGGGGEGLFGGSGGMGMAALMNMMGGGGGGDPAPSSGSGSKSSSGKAEGKNPTDAPAGPPKKSESSSKSSGSSSGGAAGMLELMAGLGGSGGSGGGMGGLAALLGGGGAGGMGNMGGMNPMMSAMFGNPDPGEGPSGGMGGLGGLGGMGLGGMGGLGGLGGLGGGMGLIRKKRAAPSNTATGPTDVVHTAITTSNASAIDVLTTKAPVIDAVLHPKVQDRTSSVSLSSPLVSGTVSHNQQFVSSDIQATSSSSSSSSTASSQGGDSVMQILMDFITKHKLSITQLLELLKNVAPTAKSKPAAPDVAISKPVVPVVADRKPPVTPPVVNYTPEQTTSQSFNTFTVETPYSPSKSKTTNGASDWFTNIQNQVDQQPQVVKQPPPPPPPVVPRKNQIQATRGSKMPSGSGIPSTGSAGSSMVADFGSPTASTFGMTTGSSMMSDFGFPTATTGSIDAGAMDPMSLFLQNSGPSPGLGGSAPKPMDSLLTGGMGGSSGTNNGLMSMMGGSAGGLDGLMGGLGSGATAGLGAGLGAAGATAGLGAGLGAAGPNAGLEALLTGMGAGLGAGAAGMGGMGGMGASAMASAMGIGRPPLLDTRTMTIPEKMAYYRRVGLTSSIVNDIMDVPGHMRMGQKFVFLPYEVERAALKRIILLRQTPDQASDTLGDIIASLTTPAAMRMRQAFLAQFKLQKNAMSRRG